MKRLAAGLPRLLLMVAALGACGGGRTLDPNGSPGSGLAPGDHELRIQHGGTSRRYLVHAPPAAATGIRLPVLLAFHGGGGTPDQFKRTAGIDAVADRESFIAVYPAGTGLLDILLTWNAGTACCGRALALDVDDVGFARAVVEDLARRTPIDPSRVYATGHSNGAGMAYRLAIQAGDLLAAIAPVAGASMGVDFRTATRIPVLHIHSVDDPRALYEGGLGPPFPGTDSRVQHRSVPDDLAIWTALNGCVGGPSVQKGLTNSAGHVAEHLVWSCASGAPVEHWRLQQVGHGWPGATEPPNEAIVGPYTNIISAADEVWAFVSRFRR